MLLDLLTSGSGVIIGDENQSIYRFRYAHPQGIRDFDVGHDPTHDEDLDECRRCPTRVVALANSLIMHNHPGAAEAQLLPREGNPEGEVHIVQWPSIESEATGVAAYVHWLVGVRGYSAGDILILSPRRQIAYSVRDALKAEDVAAHSFYHEEALEEGAAQEAFAYLTLLADPEDRVALRFLLGQGSSTWLAGQYAKLRSYCEHNGLSPREALDAVAGHAIEIPGIAKLAERHAAISAQLGELDGLSTRDLVDALFQDGVNETQLLRDSVMPMVADDIEPSVLLARLRNLITQPEMPESADFVRIMSLQKSKGLTNKVVIVLGCVAGLLPSVDRKETPADQEEILREQRRLFYVAMTRPTDILALSSFVVIDKKLAYRIGAEVRAIIGPQARTIASRFLGELGPTTPAAKSGIQWQQNGYA